MVSRLTAVLATTILVSAFSGVAAAEPFELRGIKLGIPLSQFRALPFPDQAEQRNPVKVICTGDPEAPYTLDVYGDEADAGVIYCNYFAFEKSYESSVLPPEWNEKNLKVATVGAYTTFRFIPDPAGGEYRLYQIELRTNIDYWSKFWEALTGKYGKPSTIDNTPAQNQMGASFDNITASWGNNESSILAVKRFQRIDDTYIFYTHTALAAMVKKLVEQKKGKPADNL